MNSISKLKNKQKIVIILLSINLIFSLLSFSSIFSLGNIIISILLLYWVIKKTIKSYSNARSLLIAIFIINGTSIGSFPSTLTLTEILLIIFMLAIISASFFIIISIRKDLFLQLNNSELK